MECPTCKGSTKVINTGSKVTDSIGIRRGIKLPENISAKNDSFTLRRMICKDCRWRFNSIEITCDEYDLLRRRFRLEMINELIGREKDNG